MSEELNILKALIEELRRLNDNFELHNDILINHYETTGEITTQLDS